MGYEGLMDSPRKGQRICNTKSSNTSCITRHGQKARVLRCEFPLHSFAMKRAVKGLVKSLCGRGDMPDI